VADVLTQPPFLFGTALDLHGVAEVLKISVPILTPGPALALAPPPVEEKEKLIAIPVTGKRNSGAEKALPSVTAAGEAELSGTDSTVEEREKLAQVHVTGTLNFVAEKALPSGTAAGEAELSGAASTVEEKERPIAVSTCRRQAQLCHRKSFVLRDSSRRSRVEWYSFDT
jgi:hypothetical protein